MTHPIAPAFVAPVPDQLRRGLTQLDAVPNQLGGLLQAWRGERPASFLSADSRKALDDRLARLGVNYPRLAVTALVDRMRLAGISLGEGSTVWQTFTRARGRELAELVHTDRLLYGKAYVTVWATEDSRPTITGDSPFAMTHGVDPATGRATWAVRRWQHDEGTVAAMLYTPESIVEYRGSSGTTAGVAASSLRHHRTIDNKLDALPVVPFVRRASLSDELTGSSAVADLLDLTDAGAKVLGDAMVTSEFYARPRRWATGLEIEEDEDGRPVDPFGARRFLQSEDPETKFGQLDPARLDGYADLFAVITQSVGALSGLPAHYLGLHGDQPASADGIRAAEAQLVARALSEQRHTADEWGEVAVLLDAVARGVPVDPDKLGTAVVTWDSPETRTPAMDADAATKLHGIGVPLRELLVDRLGYDPDEADRVAELALAERSARLQLARAEGTTGPSSP